MLELLGVIFGGALRLFPTVLDFLSKRKEADLEIERMKLEAQLEDARSVNRLKEIQAASAANIQLQQVQNEGAISVAEMNAIQEALRGQSRRTGDKWLDRVNVSVRPILTYWWCIVLHTAHKIVLAVVAIQAKTPLAQWAPLIYTDFDRAVVGSIIGFWFVDRSLRQLGK